MPALKGFKAPVIVDSSTVNEEKIYSFSRREIFSPAKTHNANLKFCTVSGPRGAESKSHCHPGDEIVFTLKGGNTNFLKNEKIFLEPGQAISIPPKTAHTTTVDNIDGWQGLSFYCDDCNAVKKFHGKKKNKAVKKSLGTITATGQNNFQIKEIFSPCGNETAFMTLYAVAGGGNGFSNEIKKPGETVYYCMEGNLSVSFQNKTVNITDGMAILLPPGLIHTLNARDSNGFKLIAGSCSQCPLIHKKITEEDI